MTDKERLEEVKKKYFMYENYTGKVIMYHHVLEWLIEQAERVQELESRIADDEHFVVEILEQNKHYRELLESIKNSFHKYLTAQTNESDLIADVDFFTKEIYLALEESK